MGLDLLPSPEEGLAWSALHGHCNESNRDHCRASDIEIWVKALGHIATAAAAVGSRQPDRPFGVVDIAALILESPYGDYRMAISLKPDDARRKQATEALQNLGVKP